MALLCKSGWKEDFLRQKTERQLEKFKRSFNLFENESSQSELNTGVVGTQFEHRQSQPDIQF